MADGAIPESVTVAWQHAVDGWDQPARHEALLGLVAQHNCYAWAAARYKQRAGDPIADAQLERLRRASTASLLATATVRKDAQPYRATISILVVMMLVLGLGLFYAMVLRDNHPAPTTKPAGH